MPLLEGLPTFEVQNNELISHIKMARLQERPIKVTDCVIDDQSPLTKMVEEKEGLNKNPSR